MDGQSVSEKFGITFTPSGIAAMWLRGHASNCGQDEIESLGKLIEGIYHDGMKKGIEHALDVVAVSPTPSAAQATLEADIVDLKREARVDENALDFDLTEYAKSDMRNLWDDEDGLMR